MYEDLNLLDRKQEAKFVSYYICIPLEEGITATDLGAKGAFLNLDVPFRLLGLASLIFTLRNVDKYRKNNFCVRTFQK